MLEVEARMGTCSTDRGDHAGVPIPPPLLYFALAGLSGALQAVWPWTVVGRDWAWWLAGALCVPALGLVSWAAWVMRRAGTHIQPHKPALALVREGPYRWTRNPMYIALCAMMLVWGLAINSGWGCVMVIPLWLLLNFAVVPREEKYLEAKFGDRYGQWKQRVRRWV